MGSQQVQPLQVRMDLGIMAIKEHSTFPRAPELQSHHQCMYLMQDATQGQFFFMKHLTDLNSVFFHLDGVPHTYGLELQLN